MRNILFCNLAYLPFYDTNRDKVQPKNGGSYVAEKQEAFEQYNFEKCEDGYYRGFVETGCRLGYENGQKTNTYNSLHIEKIDPSAENKGYIQDVLVVFCARPENGKTRIVGWYDHATVFRKRPKYNGRAYNGKEYNGRVYNLCTAVSDAHLLPENERTFEIPRANENKDNIGFGQSNLWYAKDSKSQEFAEKVIAYIENHKK